MNHTPLSSDTETSTSKPSEIGSRGADRWAQLRFSVVGPLLAAPPEKGTLRAAIVGLSKKQWRHPIDGRAICFSVPTLERWYYAARRAEDPIAALRNRPRGDAGKNRTLSPQLIESIQQQYKVHPQWSVQLHYDNLKIACGVADCAGECTETFPSYSTVRRFMKQQGMHKRNRPQKRGGSIAAQRAAQRLERLEVRSYEVDHAHSLWHLDFHHGSIPILTPQGEWVIPILLGIIDDHSRLICHLQWYLQETTEVLVHGLCQAFQKRALPRALMTDNGAAMSAGEFSEGLSRLSIVHETTLPYSPYQNAKQESFWATLEGRLMRMLDRVEQLSLADLNKMTLAWVEQEYHRTPHQELGCPPLTRYLESINPAEDHPAGSHPPIGRESPSSEQLALCFCLTETRRQRRSDGTISVAGKRYEIPGRYRHLEQVTIRYARWSLSRLQLVDSREGHWLAWLYPLNKSANASGERRAYADIPQQADSDQHSQVDEHGSALPPLMQQLLLQAQSSGAPPAYLPFGTGHQGATELQTEEQPNE